MCESTPCLRHARTVWIANCSDCTRWHLAVAIARRGGLPRTGHDTDR
jgi:hypothetical protein